MKNAKILHTFEEWKEWVKVHGMLPSSVVDNKQERTLYFRMKYAATVFEKRPRVYSEELIEYVNMISKYSEKAKELKNKEKFKRWKEWVALNNRLPMQRGKSDEERALHCNMLRIFKCFELQPEIYADEAKEYEEICMKYQRPDGDYLKETFLEWKKFCIEHGHVPHARSEDVYEAKLYRKMHSYLFRMRGEIQKYIEELIEYDNLNKKYNKTGLKVDFRLETFEEWKAWVLKYTRTPDRKSSDAEERSIAEKMVRAIIYFKKSSLKHPEIIAEYEDLNNLYNTHGTLYISRERIFECWKKWVKENDRLPKNDSPDKYEKYLSSRINLYFKKLYQEREKNIKLIQEYEQICYQYKMQARVSKYDEKLKLEE